MKFKMKYLLPLLALLVFGVGAYTLKINNTGHMNELLSSFESSVAEIPTKSYIAVVGDYEISSEDIDFEFKLQTKDIFDSNELSPIPNLGKHAVKELEPLKERIASALIESKLLYAMIQKDRTFDVNDPVRFKACLTEWRDTIENSADFKTKIDQKRLKDSLCEHKIIAQYLEEVIYKDIVASEEEILEYYKNNTATFKRPEMVEIRHILLSSEKEARQVRAKLRRTNFAQMAKEYSISPEAGNGGKLGPYSKNDMPQIFSTAFRMRRGEVSNILKSPYGYHFIMVENESAAKELSLEEATPIIISKIRAIKKSEKYQEFVDHALGSIDIKTQKSLW